MEHDRSTPPPKLSLLVDYYKELVYCETSHPCYPISHRSLGVEHSFVLSTSLDNWTDTQVDHMAENGNRLVNEILEYCVPKTIEVPCLSYTDRDTREKYISAKYVQQLFKQSNQVSARPPERVARKYSLQHSPSPLYQRRTYSAMIEYLGILNVRLVECSNLIVKDLTSSDPYCVLKLGTQVCKTTTKYNTLSPVYNEDFTFSWDGLEALVVEIFDKDELTKDDHMGMLEVDLQPLLKREGLMMEKWVTVRHRKKDKEQGKVKFQISFTCIK